MDLRSPLTSPFPRAFLKRDCRSSCSRMVAPGAAILGAITRSLSSWPIAAMPSLSPEFPRIHRLRQEISQRRQRRVGPQRCKTISPGGAKYLIAEGIADPKRIGILGGSYGGYATLAGVAFTPDLYRAAVDIVGPSNLITLLDAIPPYWESARKVMYARMADPGTPEGKAWMKERSPLHRCRPRIKTPLMVVQGANDPRVLQPWRSRADCDRLTRSRLHRGIPARAR